MGGRVGCWVEIEHARIGTICHNLDVYDTWLCTGSRLKNYNLKEKNRDKNLIVHSNAGRQMRLFVVITPI